MTALSRTRWRMSWRVPLTDITIPEEDVQAVLECLRSGWLTMGPRTRQFEEAFAEYIGIAARGGGIERHGRAAPLPASPPASGRATR